MGVEVNITNQETGTGVSLMTNNDGVYRSPALAPGTYQIQATASGFKMLTRKDVTLHLGDTLGLDFELEIGQSTQSVTVSGAASLLNTEDASLGQTVGVEAVQSLPMVSRRPTALPQLSPTVRYIGDDQISFGAPRYNMCGFGNVNVMFKGAPAGSDRTNVNQQTSNPPVEAIKEARLQANSYSAEYGYDVGSLVLFETKSGTNQFHGSLYEYVRNEAMDASNAFSQIKAQDRYNVCGVSVGGAIIKKKLFFFTTQEGSKENNPTSTVLTVPSPTKYHRPYWRNGIPLFDYLYSEYALRLGGDVATGFCHPEEECIKHAMVFINGIQNLVGIGHLEYDYETNHNSGALEMMGNICAEQRTYAREYEEIDLPGVELPRVFHSAWRSQRGELGYLLVNWTGAAEKARLALIDGQREGGKKIHAVTANSKVSIPQDQIDSGVVDLTILPRSILLIEESSVREPGTAFVGVGRE